MTSNQEKVDLQGSRVRRCVISPELYPMLLEDGLKFEVLSGIPKGAQFRGYAHDVERNVIVVFVEHESFDVIENSPPTAFSPVLRKIEAEVPVEESKAADQIQN